MGRSLQCTSAIESCAAQASTHATPDARMGRVGWQIITVTCSRFSSQIVIYMPRD